MAECDIFREQLALKFPRYGHALWEPSPRDPNHPVQVGDVGFISNGRFIRLFNALLPAEHPSHEFGVPDYYERFVPKSSKHLDKRTLPRKHYCSPWVKIEADPGYQADPDDLKLVTFKYDRKRGAAVSCLPVAARREDTLAQSDFKSWIVKNIDSWFAFAQKLSLGVERMEELMFVTGCDLTKSWTNIAFYGNQDDSQASFGVEVKGEDPDITFQSSPENIRGAQLQHGPEGKNLPENQCVFVRGFHVARSFWIFPKRPKAAAGPSSDPSGYDCDPDMEVMSIPAASKYRDPIYILLDYIAEQAPDCDMVLAHDDDLMNIDGLGHDSSLETLEPDVMTDILRRSNVEIHQVSFAPTPKVSRTDIGSNTDSDTSIIKVAMLPMKSENWDSDTGPQCQGLPFELNIDLSSTGELHIPGSFPVPTIQGHTSGLKTSLPADYDGGVNPVLQDLSRLKHATEHIVLALGGTRNELSSIWSNVSKFAHAERNTLTAAVIVIGWAATLLAWVFSFTWAAVSMVFFTLLLASIPSYLLSKRVYGYILRFEERFENLQQRVGSLQSNVALPTGLEEQIENLQQRFASLQSNLDLPTGLDDRKFNYRLVMAKEAPGRLERSMQDIGEPVIPGPSEPRKPLAEIASPYHIDVDEGNISDATERSSIQAAPHSPKHSDSETDAFSTTQSITATGAVATTITTEMHPLVRKGSSSSASPGGGGDDDGEIKDDTHEHEREWEREVARRG